MTETEMSGPQWLEGATLCGQFVCHQVARFGTWYPCALESGHDGPHRASGECCRHGYYIGDPNVPPRCPHWPTCAGGVISAGADCYLDNPQGTPSPRMPFSIKSLCCTGNVILDADKDATDADGDPIDPLAMYCIEKGKRPRWLGGTF